MAYLTTHKGQPVLILKEGTGRKRGRDAHRNNITATRIIGEVLKTTLGPRAMDKMVIDSLGDITITNDGAAILDEIDVEHPAAKMVIEVAKTQDDEVGDGTTTAVVLTGELLQKAQELLDQNVHPTLIVSGYRKAAKKALEILEETGLAVDLEDHEILKTVATTAMASKNVGGARDHLAKIAVEAVKQITEKKGEQNVADIDQVQIIKKEGKSLLETQLVKGIIVDKEVLHSGMPKRMENARIALIADPLEVKKTEFDSEIRIRNPAQLKAFQGQETHMLRKMVQKIEEAGANVVFCQKGIDDLAQHFLAKHDMLAVRRVKKSDMEKLSRATEGKVVTSLDDLTSKDLGNAGLVEEHKIGEDKMIFVEKCKDPRSVSILIRAGLERMVDEAERAMHDALSVVADVVQYNRIVAGGGAVESEIAKQLREYAPKVGGREQLAIEAFADSVEIVPKTLAGNAGLEPIDILVALRSAHEKPNGYLTGVDVFTGKVVDMHQKGVLEPLMVKRQAVKLAEEAASMIIRIDDVIAAKKTEAPPTPPPRPGAPGMASGMGAPPYG